jgi:hypothetical protein
MIRKSGCLLLMNSNLREKLNALKGKPKFERMLHTAALLTELFESHGIKPIIVGGFSVEIYTQNNYTTQDIDFVLSGYEKVDQLLKEIGFNKEGRYWYHPEIDVAIEVPDSFLAGDYEKVTTLQVLDSHVYLIGIEDIIMDRLRATVHWKSASDREWGFRLFAIYFEDIDIPYMKSKVETSNEAEELEKWIEEMAKL